MKTNKCKYCNQAFISKRSDAIFCSAICRTNKNIQSNKDRVIAYKAEYYKQHKETIDKKCTDRYYNNKETIEDKQCLHCLNTFTPNRKDKMCCSRGCSDKYWKSKNPDYLNEWHKNYYSTNLNRRLATCLRSRLNKALKGNIKSIRTIELLGCSVEEFKQHLESQFESWMTWDNYGNGKNKWNIDHIIPLDAFDLTNERQLMKACNHKNMRPLLAKINSSKGAKSNYV